MKILTILAVTLILGCVFDSPESQNLSPYPTRPVVMGRNGVVTSGHHLSSELGIRIMKKGGNAIDAGVAMVLAQSLLESPSYGFGGEVPTLVYFAEHDKVYSINGNMAMPKAATIQWFKDHNYAMIPNDGFTSAGVCAVPDALVQMLVKFGTMSFAEIAEGSICLAEDGFLMYDELHEEIKKFEKKLKERFPTSVPIFLPNGKVPEIGEVYRNRDWANFLKRLVQAEKDALKQTGGDRHAGLMAVRDYFYKGPIAEEIVTFQQETKVTDIEGGTNHGLLTVEDFAEYHCKIEEPVSVNYRGHDVYKCGPWTQGPVFLQHLNILEKYDLKAMGHNGVEYIHTWLEAAKLAHADKETYYGDPDFVYVPIAGLLSKEYAAERKKRIDPDKASLELIPGDPYPYDTHPEKRPKDLDLGALDKVIPDHGTTGTRAIDAQGNMFSATPSGGWWDLSPIIPGLGFCLGTRGQMFYLEEGLAKSLEGGKRPSTSLTPTLVMKEGKPLMAFGMPGGDLQDQGTLSCFLNIIDFGMGLQEALDAPKFWTLHSPSLFYPHKPKPGNATLEGQMENLDPIVTALKDKGHDVVVAKPWSGDNTMICMIDHKQNILKAVVNPRMRRSIALSW